MNRTALKSIGSRLKEQCTSALHIDIFNQQYLPNFEGISKQFLKPALFIEFGETAWSGDESEGTQEGDGTVSIHVVMKKLSDTYKIFDKTDSEQDDALAHFDLSDEVQKALHGWQAEGTNSPMIRLTSQYDHDYDNLIVEVHTYHFRDLDYAADRTVDYIDKTLTDVDTDPTLVLTPGDA